MKRARDGHLLVRMALATAAGVLVNALVVGFLALALTPFYGVDGDPGPGGSWETAVATGVERLASGTGVAVVLALAVVLTAVQGVRSIRRGRRAVADRGDAVGNHGLDARVARLAQVADVPAPSVRVIPAEEPNCFTIGRSGNATLVATDELLDALNDEQLDAVLAHELAHVASHDVSVVTALIGQLRSAVTAINLGLRVAFLFAAVTVLTVVGSVAGAEGVTAGFLGAVLAADAYVAGWVLVLGTFLVATAWVPRRLSQYREFAADRAAARITGNPAALATVLRRLEGADKPETDLRTTAGRALWLLSRRDDRPTGPLASVRRLVGTFETDAGFPPGETVDSLTAFHPPVERRIERLQSMAGEQARGLRTGE